MSSGATPPESPGILDRIRGLVRRRPLGSTATVALVLAVAVGAAAAAGPNGEISDLKHEKSSLTGQLASASAESADANDALATARDRLAQAEGKLAQIGDLQERKRSLSRQISALVGRVRTEEAKLAVATDTVSKSSITEGTWRSGEDYLPGTYQSAGGDSCYWAKLTSPSGDGIDNVIDNGGFTVHQIVSVDSPYFETRGCGTWRRTG